MYEDVKMTVAYRLAGIRLVVLMVAHVITVALICTSFAACASTSVHIATVLPTATHVSVALSTDFTDYHAGQAIGVTVSNAAPVAYFAIDTHSACTIVTLQELVRGQWVSVMPCLTGQPPHVLVIASRSSVPYALAPGNASGNPNAWDPGTYRIALAYGARSDGLDANSHLVYSAGFFVSG
jgi:hypothetical protein